MTSIFNAALIELQNRILTALPDSADTPGIRYVERDLQQIDVFESRPAVPDTGVLVDFIQANYVQRQFSAQWAEIIVRLRLYKFMYQQTSSLAPSDIREKALYFHELESKLYLILQDWDINGLLMTPMRRISVAGERRNDGIAVRAIDFKCTYEDRTLQTGGIIIPPINPVFFRIDFAVTGGSPIVQDDRLKGKTVAHIMQVSREGDDKFQILAEPSIPTDKQVVLDNAAGTLRFLNNLLPDENVWAHVLTK